MKESIESNIKIGISACLMGQPVRFNGGHKRSRFCTDVLSKYFEFVGVCPEVGIGMSTPRQAIRLMSENADDSNIRAVGSDDASLDVTEQLIDYAEQKASEMNDLCGFIFMQKSPSCGMERVKVYEPNGHPAPATGQRASPFAAMVAVAASRTPSGTTARTPQVSSTATTSPRPTPTSR